MMMGKGPYGRLEMGGMFTVVKVRDEIAADYRDPGWYQPPKGTLAWRVAGAKPAGKLHDMPMDPGMPMDHGS
jgi:hypothetical protein